MLRGDEGGRGVGTIYGVVDGRLVGGSGAYGGW